MNYLKIIIFCLFALTPQLIFAEISSGAQSMPDFSQTIFSGKYVPAPPVAPAPTPKSSPAKQEVNNGEPGSPSSLDNNTKPSFAPRISNPFASAPSFSPQNNSANPPIKNFAAGAADFHFGPPEKPELTDLQKEEINDAKMHDEAMQKAFDHALNQNFDTYTFPKEYYQQPFSKQNSHLPPVDFASYYASQAFKFTKSDDYVNVRYFVKKYNFIDVHDENGNSLLMTASCFNSIKTARMLLANNIFYINEQNKQNLRTPLHIAVMNSNYEMVRLLLTMGASTTIHDSTNMTPLDYSSLLDNSQINNLLLAYSKH